ncbi:hypothetical protein AB0J13_40700 [Streptomyces anulatus]|uniref:hypothetical protein n=1 Tax=Streptomyces anulatus TaxID=1892 RepID=UPI0033D621DD
MNEAPVQAGSEGEIEVYLRHRRDFRAAVERPEAMSMESGPAAERYGARLEIVALARTVADLVEGDPAHELGTWCAYVDPTGDDPTYEEAHRSLWSASTVRGALTPVVAALRSVEEALDEVDAVDFRPGLLDSLMARHAQLGGSPDWVPGRLSGALAEERSAVLERHGLTPDLWQFLEYRHLPLDNRRRSLYVRPALPWPHAGRGLGDAIHAYAEFGVDRHRAARERVVENRAEYAADLLPPSHWVW